MLLRQNLAVVHHVVCHMLQFFLQLNLLVVLHLNLLADLLQLVVQDAFQKDLPLLNALIVFQPSSDLCDE